MEARYEIRDQIGKGGLGTVFRGYDTRMNREVAIKRIPLHSSDPTLQEEATRQLIKEAGALASLQHPHIVTIYDVGADEDGPYVVMELLTGRSLDELIDTAPLTWPDFRELVLQTQEALIGAHELDLIHSDIKPANLMLSWLPSGKFQVKIVDFGLATLTQSQSQEELKEMESVFGSIFFMPPEQFERKLLDARSDIYSMGCVYYQALAGIYPYDGKSVDEVMQAHLSHQVKPLQDVRADIPLWACDWVMWQINRLPEDRPESVRESLGVFFQNDMLSNPALSHGESNSGGGQRRPRLIIPDAVSGINPSTTSHPVLVTTATAPVLRVQQATAAVPMLTATSRFATGATAPVLKIQKVTTAVTPNAPHDTLVEQASTTSQATHEEYRSSLESEIIEPVAADQDSVSSEDTKPTSFTAEFEIPHQIGSTTSSIRLMSSGQPLHAKAPSQPLEPPKLSNSTKILIGSAVGIVVIAVAFFVLKKPAATTSEVPISVEKPAEQKAPEALTQVIDQPLKATEGIIPKAPPANATTGGKLPEPWSHTKLFPNDPDGSVIYDAGKFVVTAAGSLGYVVDGGGFVYQTMSGDGSIIARVNDVGPSKGTTRAGIMIRENTDTAAIASCIFVNSEANRITWINRLTHGAQPSHKLHLEGARLPNIWFGLERTGNLITAKYSDDGITWQTVGQQTIEFSADTLVGLVATSGTNIDLTAATFSQVAVAP